MTITTLVCLPGPARGQERSQMRFRAMDQNGDGVITRREWRGNDQSFRVHDWNGDGILSGDEVNPRSRPPVRAVDPDERDNPNRPFSDWTEARFRELDHNRDNRLTRDEWHFSPESFRRADYNGDQRLTLAEFLGTNVDDDDRLDRFDDIDANSDGRITRDEWHGGSRAFAALDRNSDGTITRREMNYAAAVGTSGQSGQMTPTSTAYRAGYDRGVSEGRTAGREDKANGHGWDLEGQTELERADSGYAARLGSLNDYQEGYRAGFRSGYRAGFGPR